jgi:hypothetical protein
MVGQSRSVTIGLALLIFSATAFAQQLSLRIQTEQVPPGGVIQVKLELTEPKPISTGGGHLFLQGFTELLGAAVQSANGDAAAAIVWQPERPTIRVVSPSGTLGLSDYPLLTLTMRVPDNVPIGTRQPLRFDGGIEFRDATGTPYLFEVRDGEAVIRSVPAISHVSPGSASLPAGAEVLIHGTGFTPGLEVRFEETALGSVTVLNSSLIRVVLGSAAVMHGMGIEIRQRSPDFRTTYFSYQRTSRIAPSAHPLVAAIEPAFPLGESTDTTVAFPVTAFNQVPGLALQNVTGVPAAVTINVSEFSAETTLVLPPNTRAVRTLEELFGMLCQATACTTRIRSNVPVQVMGILGDLLQQAATPVLPAAVTRATPRDKARSPGVP